MRALVLLAMLLIGLAAPAGAADDVATAQTVIRSQTEAFGRDDAQAGTMTPLRRKRKCYQGSLVP